MLMSFGYKLLRFPPDAKLTALLRRLGGGGVADVELVCKASQEGRGCMGICCKETVKRERGQELAE